MKKILLVVSFLFLVTSFVYADENKIVAIVNNEIITSADVNTFLRFMYLQLSAKYKGRELEEKIQGMKPDVVNRLIEDRLLVQEAKRLDVKIDNNRIKSRVNQMQKGYPSQELFLADLEKNGLTLHDVETKIQDQIIMYDLVDYKVRSKVTANPNDVTKVYNERANDYTQPEKRKIIAIKSTDEKKIKQLLAQIKAGKDFRESAGVFGLSIDELGEVSRDQLKDELGQAVFGLNAGEVSQLIKLEDNFYIIKLEEIIPAKKRTLDEAKQDITNALLEETMQAKMTEMMDELKKKAYIEIKKD